MGSSLIFPEPVRKAGALTFGDACEALIPAAVHSRFFQTHRDTHPHFVASCLPESSLIRLEAIKSGISIDEICGEVTASIQRALELLMLGSAVVLEQDYAEREKDMGNVLASLASKGLVSEQASTIPYCDSDKTFILKELGSVACGSCGERLVLDYNTRCTRCGTPVSSNSPYVYCNICGGTTTRHPVRIVMVTNNLQSAKPTTTPVVNYHESLTAGDMAESLLPIGFRDSGNTFHSNEYFGYLLSAYTSYTLASDHNIDEFVYHAHRTPTNLAYGILPAILETAGFYGRIRVFQAAKSLPPRPLIDAKLTNLCSHLSPDHIMVASLIAPHSETIEHLEAALDIQEKIGAPIARVLQFAQSKFPAGLPAISVESLTEGPDTRLVNEATTLLTSSREKGLSAEFSAMLANLVGLAQRLMDYFITSAPWTVMRSDPARAAKITHLSTRVAASLLISAQPILPYLSEQYDKAIKIESGSGWLSPLDLKIEWKQQTPGNYIHTPKTNVKSLVDTLNKELNPPPEVTIDEFSRFDLRVAHVKSVERIGGTRKLLRIRIRIGEEHRTIVSSIGDQYAPEELVGKSIVVLTNLKPAKFAGVVSYGMLLAAEKEGAVSLLTIMREITDGVKIH
ncbi:MAG: methionine--tRNA ligase subunit beta [Candidatus Marsarchaeota archaeon]|nr:methionine--tRNA ligase subunit beta [Candidatus Marsarchaeota archaeon]